MDGAGTGRWVRERLMAHPGVQRVPLRAVDVFVLRDFIDADARAALTALIDADSKPSRLFADNPDPAFRTSRTCNLDPADPVVHATETRFTDLLGIDPAHGERLQGQRYDAGQEFKPHHDYLRTTEAYWARQQAVGGQRTWTCMVYLDAPEAGGATRFPLVDLTIPPRPGTLVAWNNLDENGEPNPATLHQGMPVLAGVKHIVTKWHRERPWGPPPA
jgi:prolyl 4-hydroxylase